MLHYNQCLRQLPDHFRPRCGLMMLLGDFQNFGEGIGKKSDFYQPGDKMSIQATTTFVPTSWDEKPYAEFGEGRKLTRTSAAFTYTGDLQGEGSVEYLMVYNPDGSGNSIGLERVIGKIGGRAGSFVIQHNSTFTARPATSVKDHWFVVPGSGMDDLQGISAEGEFEMSGPGPYSMAFNHRFEEESQ